MPRLLATLAERDAELAKTQNAALERAANLMAEYSDNARAQAATMSPTSLVGEIVEGLSHTYADAAQIIRNLMTKE